MSLIRSRGARCAAAGLLISAPSSLWAADDTDLSALRMELQQMKRQYETRIEELEARLAVAERDAAQAARRSEAAAQRAEQAAERAVDSQPMRAPGSAATAAVPPPKPSGASAFDALTSGTAFNPQISVILDGNYYQDDIDGAGAALVGEAFQPSGGGHSHGDGHSHDDGGHAHSVATNGFNFREAELAFSATVDPYFDAATYISIDGDGNVELEEAYFETRSLPQGLRVKGGRFLSDFGYINNQHPHQWDFVDQNLPYLNLLGFHGLQDTGLQLTWLPELPVYTLFGVEALQGDQEIFGATLSDEEQEELSLGETDDGPRLWTAFAKVAPEIGRNHALQLGVSYAHNTQHQEVHAHSHAHAGEDEGEQAEEHETGLAGDADLWGLDAVYKYDGGGAYGQGDFKFQAEYLRSIKDLTVRSSAHPEQVGSSRKFTTDGLYAQAVYGFAPKWRAGLRYDVLGLTNEVSGARDDDFGSSDRWTLDLTWNLSEFSQLRAQYAYNDILVSADERERFNAFYLQFLMSLGSHGAHEF